MRLNELAIQCGCGLMMTPNSGGEKNRWGCKHCGLEHLGAKIVARKFGE